MKALTICQPYASLIVISQDELPRGNVQKRVENRTWHTEYRGPLAIHAGKSRSWLEPDPQRPADDICGLTIADMPFGAIVGVCDIVACFSDNQAFHDMANDPKWGWLATHPHTYGPWCFVLDKIQRFKTPFQYIGRQGFFNIPDDVIAKGLAS